ncbi:MAG: GNAT family N-acetyltransferase [Alphaproteobacteria bacterium]|nr:GNAT family N-acetyltransferase [Alphaproteobacteria bacterium]
MSLYSPDRAIRAAVLDDAAPIAAIYNDVMATSTAIWSDIPTSVPDREAWLAAKAGDGWPVLVVEAADGAVAGFASFGPFRPWPGYARTVEHSIHIAKDHRGQGLARAILARLIAEAARREMHVMIGGIDAANAASIKLHERLGFERAALLRETGWKFGRWLDLVLMHRMLTPQDAAGAP